MANKRRYKKIDTTTQPVDANVTRISAKDSAPATKKNAVIKNDTAQSESKIKEPKAKKKPTKAVTGYFVGAWRELKQVRWPTRRATWSLTAAVLIFSALFVGIIVLLDMLFELIFRQIL